VPDIEGWDVYFEGLHIEWQFGFSLEDMQLFARLSGDYNPIHTDLSFANSKGFKAPLIYGLLLTSQMSRLIGWELPDKHAILTAINMRFLSPCFQGDQLIFTADLVNKSDSTHLLEFKCLILNGDEIICRGAVEALWRP
jgi:acyl dehydratase